LESSFREITSVQKKFKHQNIVGINIKEDPEGNFSKGMLFILFVVQATEPVGVTSHIVWLLGRCSNLSGKTLASKANIESFFRQRDTLLEVRA
jgi:hypothetical protein